MADAILYGVVQNIIESLDSSTLKQIGSIWGVKDELKKMKNDVLTIQAVLVDAEMQQVKNHQVKDWLMKLRDVVFDADDLLSEFNTRVLRQKVMDGDKIVKKVRTFFSSSNPLVFGPEMARKIKVMRERINDISTDRDKYQLNLVERPLETRVVTRGRVQSAMSDYGNWVSNGTILDAPVSIFSLFTAYESETDVSSVFNDSPPRFSHSNSIMSIFSPDRSQRDISENYENFTNPYIMSIFSPDRSQRDISENYENFPNPYTYHISIFSPTISETGSSLSIGSTHSIPLLFPPNKSETDSGSESNETPPQFSYPMMSIFPPNSSQTDNSGNYEIIPLGTRVETRGRDQTHYFVSDEEVIGREQDKQAIINLLLDFDVEDNVSFISIVGIGGLGKTTMAQYVFNDEKVQTNFELKIWVCVSDVFDIKKIVEMIIGSTTGRKPENLDMDPLQNELRETLCQKKYLLILDDVWNEDSENWYNLKILLMGGAKGSKVVITTRTKLVAEITSTISPYFLPGLSKDQSWSLFKKMAFKKGQETINSNLKAIGMDIVEKCQGVPLAIKIIGRVLNHKKTVAEWSYIMHFEPTNVTQLKDGIMPILKLSYDHLPPHLKCCFAYCSLFPKGYLIDKLTLIQLWIAQGFIQSSPRENLQLEDVANEYFMDLLWRSFFQEVEEDQGMNRRFKMHDLIHDLAQYASRTECTLVDCNMRNVNRRVLHLSFPSGNASFIEENLNLLVRADKMHTFILTSDILHYAVEESTVKKLFSAFRYLRALDLHGLKIVVVPNSVDKLLHLRYLDLSSNDIEVLPRSITRLVNLQTLKLSWCSKLRELPSKIQRLVSLRHLDISGCENLTHMPRGLGQLTSLQTLNLFVVSEGLVGSSKHCGGLVGLNKLNDLRGKLEIKNLAWVKDATSEFKAANLKEKQRLSELILKWNPKGGDGVDAGDDENSMDSLQPHESLKSLEVDGYMGVRVSSWLSFLTNLVALYIYNCKKCQYLPPLYQLPTLRKLSIWDMDGLEYMTDGDMNDEISASLASPSTFFPSLEILWLRYCPNLKGWWRRDKGNEATATSAISSSSSSSTNHYHQHMPNFPRLSSLWLVNCPKMTCMPLFPNLEDLSLWDSSLKALEETIEMNNTGRRASSFPSSSSSSSSSFSPPLSKLKKLHLREMLELESLPEEWFKNLTSLETLQIGECPNLTSLPKGINHLTSLQTLSMTDCPQLKQRCEKENGEDWDKISHIPNFRIWR